MAVAQVTWQRSAADFGGTRWPFPSHYIEAKRSPLFINPAVKRNMRRVRQTMAMLLRYVGVGLVNTAVGYTIILVGLWLGMGDYLANAAGYIVGLTVSYFLQRRWAFAVSTPPSLREAGRFCGAALLAYGSNVAVIHSARSMGYVANPIAQAAAMVAYSITFFVLSRFVVFARPR